MMRRKMLLIFIVAMISALWLFAGYAAAQLSTANKEQIKQNRERLEDGLTVPSGLKSFADIAKTSMHFGYIPVFINPATGDIYVVGSTPFTANQDSQKFIDAIVAGRYGTVGQFYRYQTNPYCIYYYDSQGHLLKKCI
jgi:hypothetical protein